MQVSASTKWGRPVCLPPNPREDGRRHPWLAAKEPSQGEPVVADIKSRYLYMEHLDNINIIQLNDKYNIHVVTENNYNLYERFIEHANICDPIFLSKSFEQLSYASLEDSEKFIGFFLTNKNNKKLHNSMIIDLDCTKNQEAIIEFGYELQDSVEIVLLCANDKIRISGLTTEFVNFVLENIINQYKPNVKHVFLYVAQGIKTENTRAFMFYNKLGFTSLSEESPNIMVYTYKAGAKRKQRSKSKSKKTNQRKRKRITKAHRRRRLLT